jgi:hypothetical protein
MWEGCAAEGRAGGVTKNPPFSEFGLMPKEGLEPS